MSNAKFGIIGTGIGAFFGGYGAQIGWMLGSYLDASNQTIDQKQIGDLKVQTAQYGVTIVLPFGVQRVAGNVFWSTEKQPYTIKTRTGKGGPTTETTGYKIDMAIGICQGPILGISRVWANEKLIIDASTEAKPLIGALYLGDNTQLPDPTYEAAVGAGNAPAMRGLAYIVLDKFDLTPYGGTVPSFSFEVVRGATV